MFEVMDRGKLRFEDISVRADFRELYIRSILSGAWEPYGWHSMEQIAISV